VWHELFTPDVAKSKQFYQGLFGWTVDELPMGPMTYNMLKNGEQSLGGLMPLSMLGRAGVPPFWLGYVSVPSVDEAAKAAGDNGGLVAMPPTDVPHVGRMSMLGDPVHAYTSAWRSLTGDGARPQRPPVGSFCWDELLTNDPEKVKTFYQKVYGWSCKEFPGGKDMWSFNAGEVSVASLMKSPPGMQSYWLTYVAVEELDASRKKAVELGGRILVEKISIPTVGDISVITDATGAAIGLFEGPQQ
jgi:predicted enzyme related to lactoylglutathione lyase